MAGSRERVMKAFAHQAPDRTPLFELFQPYHPIHWDICGRTVATDMAMAWDAMAEGIAWEELLQAHVKAQYTIRKFFGLDMVRLNGVPRRDYPRPVKTGKTTWTLNGVEYCLNPRTQLVEIANPGAEAAYSRRISEEQTRRELERWDGSAPAPPAEPDPVLTGVRELARADGLDWVYMGEVGAGTGVAFYPPFMLMWLIEEPELFELWMEKQKLAGFVRTRQLIESGCTVIAMGGDVSGDKGPFISPAHYRRFILPEMFFQSGVDGYKEVDKAAGMDWPRLIAEGVAERVCIIGNLDARYTLCHGTTEEVRAEVVECLRYGQQTPGGHILHASHSVHEDVKAENYYAAVAAYREFFGMEPLPRLPSAGSYGIS